MYKECVDQKRNDNYSEASYHIPFTKTWQRLVINRKLAPHHSLNSTTKLALAYANRLKHGLDSIVAGTQTGFMKNRLISCNISLILDLLYYADEIKSNALILFLDFYKAFDTIEHRFLLQSLETFGFDTHFVNMVSMFYKDIKSSIVINYNISKRFQINRGVRAAQFHPFYSS